MDTFIDQVQQQITAARDSGQALRVVGANSKAFYGREVIGQTLSLCDYSGIVEYEPTELYITVKAGTTVAEVEETLAASGQRLAFEPPRTSVDATIGGSIASGLSGPARPYFGSTRDFILGIKCINGMGKTMTFGGQVMKNVAGYDLSRLLTGSLGTLAVILEVSIKVLPVPKYEVTCSKALSMEDAIATLMEISVKPLPVSAAAFCDNHLYLRLSGSRSIVDEAIDALNFDIYQEGEHWWQQLRDYQCGLFQSTKPVWRLSLPAFTKPDLGDDACIMDWGGAQYWVETERCAKELFEQAKALGGSASLFKTDDNQQEKFQPLTDAQLSIHKGLKQAFDPGNILNPGRMYADL